MDDCIDTPGFQRAIAELCVTPGTLDELRDRPQAFAARFGLSPTQVQALHDAGLERFREFAEDLLYKRLTLIEKFSPGGFEFRFIDGFAIVLEQSG